MRTGGIICIVLGSVSTLGALLSGDHVAGPVFWLLLGIFLVIKAEKKKDFDLEENKKKK